MSIISQASNRNDISDEINNGISLISISDSQKESFQDSKDIFNELVNDFDPIRIKEIHESLDEIFPKELVKMTIDYDEFYPVKTAYYHVIKRLDPFGIDSELKLENENFLCNLSRTLMRERDEIPYNDIFWNDLGGFLLKIILHLKMKMSRKVIITNSATNGEFEKILNSIQHINSIMRGPLFLTSNFNIETMSIHHFGFTFLGIEFFERSNSLSKKFIKGLKYAYFPFIIDKEERETKRFDCNEFKMKFFGHPNPNVDILLKLFMSGFDNKGEIIRACLESNIQSSYSMITEKVIKWIETDIDNLEFTGIEYFTNVSQMIHANSSTMNFILANASQVLMHSEFDLYWLLKRLQETELLNRENVEAIVKFENNPPTNKLDSKSFKDKLKSIELFYYHLANERIFINQCLEELFESKLLKEEPIK